MTLINTGKDNYVEERFILLYNKYYTENDPQQLTPKELQTLIILKEYTSKFKESTITTLNLLGHLLPFSNIAEKKKNAAIAKQIILSLKNKGVVDFDEPKGSNDPFEIMIEKIQYVEGDLRTSYQPVPEFIFGRTNDPDELYVLIVIHSIAKMDDKGDYSKPYYRHKKNWGGLLGKGNTTAEKIINKMCQKEILFYYENDVHYNAEDKKYSQHSGRYYLFAQDWEEERIKIRDQKREMYRSMR